MMKAFVLVKFISLEARDAYRMLVNLASVVESYTVFGRFDAVVMIQAENLDEIRHILLVEVQNIPGVVETMHLLIADNPDLLSAKGKALSHNLSNQQLSSL
jgi:DNA-binding Lrp family transcriptional regulator